MKMADHPGPPPAPGDPAALHAENTQLRDALQRHRRLLTGISATQHAIAQRVPLQTVRDSVVQVAEKASSTHAPSVSRSAAAAVALNVA